MIPGTEDADTSAGQVQRKPVVVGYDGSDGAKRAVLWAAHYALAAQLRLVVVHCWVWPLFTHDLGPVTGVQDSGLRREAEKLADEGRDLAAEAEPHLDVRRRLIVGLPAGNLTALSQQASLLVTGTRGLGGFAGLLVGSVSFHLASSASCPVVVVREARADHDAVLVAVDGSPESERAVAVAADLAASLRTSVRLLHVQQHRRHAPSGPVSAVGDEALERASALLSEHTGIAVTRDLVVARSVPGLILEEARNAAVVVLGAKGTNTLGVRLGSTVHAVLHHARGNVVVVR
ncbi:universal stress protein [Arthrobacter sp. MDT1-48-3]|uniref:Universal stress protein n=1 Tax=Arthrobacter agilis TaxID=37921 RepID=A0A2L0UGC1_9MICC|nr:universal stress protein [Arthrobacter agilis]AUZ88301.1 universal stress protein [Arthrobacter agilis]